MSDVTPQPHGGVLRPFSPGNGPAANRTSLKKINREVHAVLATNAVDLTERMVRRALETDDDRVLAVITAGVLDRVQGKAAERPQSFDDEAGVLDTTGFTPEQEEHALECARHLQAYVALSRQLAAERAEQRGGVETET